MRWLDQFRFHFRSLFAKKQLDEQLSEEIKAHVDMATEANIGKGMAPEEARYAALREFGNVAGIQERTREERGWVWLERLRQDSVYALRAFRRSPGFTAIAVLSLALGIGANTALFSLIDETLLRQLPVKKPDELVLFRWLSNSPPYEGIVGRSINDPATGLTMDTALSLPIFLQLREASQGSMDDVFAFAPLPGLAISCDGQTDRGRGQVVTGNYFSALGISSWRGRLFDPNDDRLGAMPVVVVSHRFWEHSLHGDEDSVGKVIIIGGLAATVIGVTPPDFNGALQAGEAPDVTLPLSCEPLVQAGLSFTNRPMIWWLHVMGRLKPGVSNEQAKVQLETAFRRAVEAVRALNPPKPNDVSLQPRDRLRLEPGGQGLADIRQSYQRPLVILMGLAVLMLLLACVNVANLLLARSVVRRREIAIRISIGATRGRIVRQLLTESLLLALAGGVIGILLARWGREALLQLWPVGDSGSLILDQRTLGFTAIVSAVTGIAFGLAPAWQASSTDLSSALKGGGRHSRTLLRGSLTVGQVALSSFILVGAGLFVGTLWRLRALDAGFDRSNLVLFEINARDAGYDDSRAAGLLARIQERVAAIPGVQSAGFGNYGLLLGQESGVTILVSRVNGEPPTQHDTGTNGVSPDFRRTMGIPLLAGRDFTGYDVAGGMGVALVNESFAKSYFPGESVIGKHFIFRGSSAFRTPDRMAEIVGVIGDTHYADLRRKMGPMALTPYSQTPLTFGGATFCLKTSSEVVGLAQVIRATVHQVESSLPVADVRTQENQVDRLFAQERLFALLTTLFGGVALFLTCIGLYGLLAHEVTARTREIGIRMAIGARPKAVFALVMRSGLCLTLLGSLLGVALSLIASSLVVQFLYGVGRNDPRNFLTVIAILLSVASIACWLPARRAAKVDPVVALRAE